MSRVGDFDKIVKFANSIGVNLNVNYNDFYTYMCILQDMNTSKVNLSEEQINDAIGIITSVWLKTDNDTDVSIGRISEYVVSNYEKAKEMNSYDILTEIVDGEYED